MTVFEDLKSRVITVAEYGSDEDIEDLYSGVEMALDNRDISQAEYMELCDMISEV